MRRVVLICIAVFSFAVYADLVSASMMGTWNVEKIETAKLKLKGTPTRTEANSLSDTWMFGGNDSFTSNDFAGAWRQRGASFTVDMDGGAVKSYIEGVLFRDEGLTVTVKRSKISGSEKKDGTTKGTYLIQATVVDNTGKAGTLTINGKFQGMLPFSAAEYFPLDQGDTWTYKRTGVSDGEAFEDDPETETIIGTENVGREIYAKRVEDDGDYLLYSNSNGVKFAKEYEIGNDGGASVESIDTYSPPIQYLPARFGLGTVSAFKSTLNHRETTGFKATAKVEGQTVVEALDDTVVVNGVEIKDCVRLAITRNLSASKLNLSQFSEMKVWLARGVGIVKEISETTEYSNGQMQTETSTNELISTNLGL